MKLLSGILGLTLTSVVALASANAADIYRAEGPGSLKDPYVPVDSWTGFYVGVNGGYGWAADDRSLTVRNLNAAGNLLLTAKTGTVREEGGFGGGQIGYNWQGLGVFGPHFVFGVETDIQGSGIGDTRSGQIFTGGAQNTLNVDANLNWFGTVRGRLGYAFDRTLFYATGGFAYGGVQDTFTFTNNGNGNRAVASRDETLTGYVVGGGVEYKINPHWSIKGEYQYINLGDENYRGTYATGGQTENVDQFKHDYHTVRAGLNYRIGHEYEPLK